MDIEKLTETDAWFIRGVCYALASIVAGSGARDILAAAGVTAIEDAADAGVDTNDLALLEHLFK